MVRPGFLLKHLVPTPGLSGPARNANTRMVIDVSVPPTSEAEAQAPADGEPSERYALYPVAALHDRRMAAVIRWDFLGFSTWGSALGFAGMSFATLLRSLASRSPP